jgi:hypothetical protein
MKEMIGVLELSSYLVVVVGIGICRFGFEKGEGKTCASSVGGCSLW